jgi:hypothetical protein
MRATKKKRRERTRFRRKKFTGKEKKTRALFISRPLLLNHLFQPTEAIGVSPGKEI